MINLIRNFFKSGNIKNNDHRHARTLCTAGISK